MSGNNSPAYLKVRCFVEDGEIRLQDNKQRVIVLHRDYFNAKKIPWGSRYRDIYFIYQLPPKCPKISISREVFRTLYDTIQEYLREQAWLLKNACTCYFPQIPYSSSKLNALEQKIRKSEIHIFEMIKKQQKLIKILKF